MKFPKSVHPEGWLEQIERGSEPTLASTPMGGAALKPRVPRSSAKIRATDPLGFAAQEPLAASVPPIRVSGAPAVAASGANPAHRTSSAIPWAVGIGAGVVLIGVAVTMSRQLPSSEAPAALPILTSDATQPVTAAPSPEDTVLAEAPPAAGAEAPVAAAPVEPVTPAPVEAAPKVAASSAPAPKVAEAAAPAPKLAQAPAPAPVERTLTPPPETLAQASPPPVTLREATPVTPVAPLPVVTPPLAEPTQPLQPPQAQPVQPPVLAQQLPPVADPADTGITIKVREALASDTTLAAVPIAVSTDHGVVKLEGQAPDAQSRERATVVAAATTGVRGVDNRLTLPPVTVGALRNTDG